MLVQAFTRRARQRMQNIMRAAEERCAAERRLPPNPTSSTFSSSIEIATSMLSEEFKNAFQQCKSGSAAPRVSPRQQLFP